MNSRHVHDADPSRSNRGVTNPAAGATEAPDTQAERRAREESLGEMFARLSQDLSTLVRQEVQLAKAELTQSAKQAGAGAGMMVGALIGALFTLLFLSTALMWALGSVMHFGWAALIVAVIWAIIAAILAMVGKKKLEEIKGLPQTQETIEEIPATVDPRKETP